MKRILTATVGLASVSLVALSPVLAGAANTGSTAVNATVASVITLTNTGSGGTAIGTANMNPATGAVESNGSDAVTVVTNDSNGYTLTLLDGDTNNSLQSGSNNIAATTGTATSPIALANNTWGYAVAGAPFSGTYTAENNAASSSLTWAAVPASGGTATTLKSTTSTTTGDTTTVWYGVKVNASQASGSYTDTVAYTATAK